MSGLIKPLTHGATGVKLNANEKLVLMVLADYHTEAKGHAWTPSGRLALEALCEERSLRRIVRRLENQHALLTVQRGRGRGYATTYWFSVDGIEKADLKSSLFAEEKRTLGAKKEDPGPLPAVYSQKIKIQNLGPQTARPSFPSCGNVENTKPENRRYAIVGRLADAATEMLKADPGWVDSLGDLAEALKSWAAARKIPYSDNWPGAASPIQQAITIALERRKAA